jgi:hypothetical protein
VLLRSNSLTPWPVGPSHPCAKCGEFVPGIVIGGMCPKCTRVVQHKAARIGRLAALGTTLPLAVWVTLSLPSDRTARIVGAGSVLLWYVLTFLIGKRIAWEWLK